MKLGILALTTLVFSMLFMPVTLSQPPGYELEKEHGSWCDELWFTSGPEPSGVIGWLYPPGLGKYSVWSALYSRREHADGSPYANNIWPLEEVDGVFNPLTGTAPSRHRPLSVELSLVYSTLLVRHPHIFMDPQPFDVFVPWCVREPPIYQPWGTGTYMNWTLRDDMTWHDGTPVTTADVEFCLDLIVNQNNQKYEAIQTKIVDVNVIDDYAFEVYYEEDSMYDAVLDISNVALLTPKHVWEPYIAGPDGILWNDDDNDHSDWGGSEWIDQYGYSAPIIDTPSGPEQLTHLIGNGPFIYPHGGWTPGTALRLIRWPGWHYTRILRGDNNLDGIVDIQDLWYVLYAFGSMTGMPKYLYWADMAYPLGLIDGRDVLRIYDEFGLIWWPESDIPS